MGFLRGFNNILPLTRDLMEASEKAQGKRDALAYYMRVTYQANQKVMRFPAGTGGKTYIHDSELEDKVIAHYRKCGVTQVNLVCNPDDLAGFKKTYTNFNKRFNVVLTEFDNENYLKSHMHKQKNKTGAEIFWFFFNKNYFYKLQAKRYAKAFKKFKTWMIENHLYSPVGAACQVPDNNFGKYWYNTIKKETNNLIMHIYGEAASQPNYWEKTDRAIKLVFPNQVWFTEARGIHFGDSMDSPKNEHLLLSDYHLGEESKLVNLALNNPNVRMLQIHSTFDIEKPNHKLNNYATLVIRENNVIEDRYDKAYIGN